MVTASTALLAVDYLSSRLISIAGLMSSFGEFTRFAERWDAFISRKPKIETIGSGSQIVTVVPPLKTLTVKNVSFTYKKGSDPVLKGVSLTIKKGEALALVGLNGAGKTTLAGLILRLYDPTEGNIFWNDIDIRKFAVNAYRRAVGMVFQDFNLYAFSLAENISMDTQIDKDRVLNALVNLNWDLKYPMDALLTKEFSSTGLVLSGGEAQNVALARTAYNDKLIYVFDEPSSALDPKSEVKSYEQIFALLKDKAALILSHRLGVVRQCSCICFLEDGQIIEQGDHDELIKANGKYAQLFNIQAQKYQ